MRSHTSQLGFVVCAVLLTLATHYAHAATETRWTPFQAKYSKTTYQRKPDGSREMTRSSTGRLYRASDGSELLTSQPVTNGADQATDSGTLRIAASKTIYVLNFQTKQALLKQSGVPFFRFRDHKEPPGAKETVNGILCSIIPIQPSGPIKSGKAWISPELDIVVKQEWETKPPGDNSTRSTIMVEEYSDFQIGKEPPASLFAIPKDFKVVNSPAPTPPHR